MEFTLELDTARAAHIREQVARGIDPFGGLADFDPATGQGRCWREMACRYDAAIRVIDECLKPPRKATKADLQKHIDMAREEIARVSGRWV